MRVKTDEVRTDIFRPKRCATSSAVEYYQRNAFSSIVVVNPNPIGVKKSPISVN